MPHEVLQRLGIHSRFCHIRTIRVSAYMRCDVWHLHPVDVIVSADHMIESVLPMHCHKWHSIIIVKYYASEDIEEYRWDIENDTEYWDFSTNILGNFTFDVHTMRKDLESLYRDTLVILMFKKCLERLDVSTDLAQITWTNEFADFNSFPMQKHLGKISAYLNKMSGVTMKLGLDENGELKVMPDFHSVFDAARFALSQYVSIPTDYPIAYADRVGVATCECCGRLFIKNGNRQKYCDNPECKKERNRRKSRTAYRRKIQEENDNRWA